MKKLFLLLLALTCFRFSYGEDLSPEQKQLAWKFINENFLGDDYLPNIFEGDITINLKESATAGDSMIVKDIIKSIQTVMPQRKLLLSGSQANFILRLSHPKGGKLQSYSATGHGKNSIHSQNILIPLPDGLTVYERKQFFYYLLLRGLTFPDEKKILQGMNGCVFAETDYKSVTFSQLDLFILEKLYAPDFPVLLSNNLAPGLQQTAWNSIRTKFLGETIVPIIFKNELSIKLNGSVSTADSAIINELIGQLKTIIPNRKIFLTSGRAKLNIDFLDVAYGVSNSSIKFGQSIQITTLNVGFAPDLSKESRKKILYFNLYRSLVDFSPSRNESTGVEGCVFDEKKPESITYHPFDAFILNKLYADDFQEQFKINYIKHTSSYRMYLVLMYHNELDTIFFLFGLIISAILLTSLILKGAFKPHNWSWKEFNKQGIYLVAIYTIYSLIISASDLQLNTGEISQLLILDLKALLAINLVFFAERFILKNRNLGGSKVFVIFMTTLVLMTVSLFRLNILYEESSEFIFKSFTSKESFLNIILFALARSLFIFLNDRYKSIINQKDVELAQMGELQKQAELQSLRAKINPHFLYNALNSIASLATTNAQKTEQMALGLSDFFKYAINREQKQLNSLSEELNATRTYLEIEKVRFGDRLNFEIECDPELLDIRIPQLLIQPLVENAIKHGLSQITGNGIIRIVITKEDHQLNIRVYDNGPAFPEGPLSGFGIQNTQERIALLYGSKATINWNNVPEKYIELSLPIVKQEFNQNKPKD